VLSLGACGGDQKSVETGPQAHPALGRYPKGTVGREASDYPLRMDRVRVWFEVVADLNAKARADTSFGLKVDYPFDSPLQAHVADIERAPVLATSLERHDMSPREFILLSTLLGAGWMATAMTDSLGPAGTPANVSGNLLTFMRTHRTELDSLRAALNM